QKMRPKPLAGAKPRPLVRSGRRRDQALTWRVAATFRQRKSQLEKPAGIAGCELALVGGADGAVVEPLRDLAHGLVGVIHREQHPVGAQLAKRVLQRLGPEGPGCRHVEVLAEVFHGCLPVGSMGLRALMPEPVLDAWKRKRQTFAEMA